jgi:hypothetical protein
MVTKKQSPSRKHSSTIAGKKTTRHKSTSRTSASKPEIPINNPKSTNFKSCQEVEIGDIGGFGDVQELEEHQKQCGDLATAYCSACGKHLCRIHYMLLHGDHNSHHTNNLTGIN